ncbi:MAG: SPOR domain-containing protein [Rhodocyclaceae bacterium]|nr:SPOR domain-containing protein [Rhodocyclaceae bacterium]
MSEKRKSRAKAQSKPGTAGGMLFGIFIGLMLGAVVAVLGAWYFTENAPFKTDGRVHDEEPVRGSEGGPVALPGRPGGKPVEKPQFDFYKILPEGERAVSAGPAESAPGRVDEAPKARLYLQAGAFENPSEADNVKARLALMGVEAAVSRAELGDKGTVHRVRIGPFANERLLDAARRELADAGIPTVPIRSQ